MAKAATSPPSSAKTITDSPWLTLRVVALGRLAHPVMIIDMSRHRHAGINTSRRWRRGLPLRHCVRGACHGSYLD